MWNYMYDYQILGLKTRSTSSGTGSVTKLASFMFEAGPTTFPAGMSTLDITSFMAGKTPGGSNTSLGVVTSYPHNKVPVLASPNRDELLTDDGFRIYGRITKSGASWFLHLNYLDETGAEQIYMFSSNTDILFGYLEVLNFYSWPVFEDSENLLDRNRLVGEIPEASSTVSGKVTLAQENEISNSVLRSNDLRSIKTRDFGRSELTEVGSNLELTIYPGTYSVGGDRTVQTNLSVAKINNNYYLTYVNLLTGTVNVINSTSEPSIPDYCLGLYKWYVDPSGNFNQPEDIRSVYISPYPHGNSGQVQFSTNGVFDSDPKFTWNKSASKAVISGSLQVTEDFELGENPRWLFENLGSTVSTLNIRAKGATNSKSLIRMVPNGNPTGDKAELTWMGTDVSLTDRWWVDMKTHETSPTLRRFHILSDANGTEEPVTRFSVEIDGEDESSELEEFSIVRDGWIAQAENNIKGTFMLRIVGDKGITEIEKNRIDLTSGNLVLGTSNGDVVPRPNNGNFRPFVDNTYGLGALGGGGPDFRWNRLHVGTGDSSIDGKVSFNSDWPPVARVDIYESTGYESLRIKQTFTPSSSADGRGSTGTIAWDNNYIYVKTSTGWKRASLNSF